MELRIIALVGLLLSGCAGGNPYTKFYQDRTGIVDITKSPRVFLPTGKPELFRGSDLDSDYIRLLENGYELIGISSFNGSDNVNVSTALKQAARVHASVVLVYSKYTNTVSGSMPWTVPDTQRSTTTLSGNVIGPGGMATYSGNVYSTTHGTKSTYIPYSENRHDYFASYWIKVKPPILGVHVRELTAELKQKIGSNKGVVVTAVMKDSPAFSADILRGDVLKRIGDTEILDQKMFSGATFQRAGKKTAVIFIRDGKEFTKEILFNERAY